VIHGAALVAVHAHVEADAVTTISPLPPAAANGAAFGAMLKVHGSGGGAVCVIVTVKPATVSVPTRSAVPVWLATVKGRRPDPVPPARPWMASQGAALAAVQVQLDAEAVTTTSPLPPAAGKVAALGAMLKVHGSGAGGAAASVTVTVVPATVSVPTRSEVAVCPVTT